MNYRVFCILLFAHAPLLIGSENNTPLTNLYKNLFGRSKAAYVQAHMDERAADALGDDETTAIDVFDAALCDGGQLPDDRHEHADHAIPDDSVMSDHADMDNPHAVADAKVLRDIVNQSVCLPLTGFYSLAGCCVSVRKIKEGEHEK